MIKDRKNNTFKFSVIIPVYNAERTIKSAIESVLRQNLTGIEIICIDDGSVDASVFIIQDFARKYQNIKFLFQDHKGAGEARNYGINEAKGEYISFLDADDYFVDRDALQRMYNAAISMNMNICSSLREWNISGNNEDYRLYESYDKIGLYGGAKISFRDYQNDFCFQSFIFKRDFLIDRDIKFPAYLRYQDPPFLLRALHEAEEFWVEPVYLYHYNVSKKPKQLNAEKTLDLLRGIMDNLLYSIDNHYYLLVERTISRINLDYYQDILCNLNPEIILSLMEINSVYKSFSGKNLNIIEEISSYYAIKQDLIKTKDAYIISEGLRKLTINEAWSDLLGSHIKDIVIYGVGNFGKRLDFSLRKAGINVAAYIDKNIDKLNGIRVRKNANELEKYDIIIVAIANYNQANKIEELPEDKVIYLSDLMWRYWNENE